jgi:fructosamine-3-kinase
VSDDEPKHRLLGPRLCREVEELASVYFGRAWQATRTTDLRDLACHTCVILSDEREAVFVKRSDATYARDQFEREIAGLRLLAERGRVCTPTVIGIVEGDCGSVGLVLEAVDAMPRGPRQWRAMGHALAALHRVKGDTFGLDGHNYWGPLRQDNTPTADWPSFYVERRILPLLRLATSAGHLPIDAARAVEQLADRMPRLCGTDVRPTLLHGDAQKNNFITTESVVFLIDPSVHFGHPEMDLAFVDYFEPVPGDFFDAYAEQAVIDPGFAERRELWRVGAWLAAVAVRGPSVVPKLLAAVTRYL